MSNKSLLRLEQIRKRNKEDISWKNSDLYKVLCREEFYQFVYEFSQSGRLRSIFLPIIPTLVNVLRQDKLSHTRLMENIMCDFTRLTFLGELLREGILTILEAIYGKSSMPFGTSVQTSLYKVNQEFNNVDWVITGEATPIDGNLLLLFLGEKVIDKKFLFLIEKILEMEINNVRIGKFSMSTCIHLERFPLLATLTNLYYERLDNFILAQTRFSWGMANCCLSSSIILSKIRKYSELSSTENFIANEETSIYYVRHQDVWLIGFRAGKSIVESFKSELVLFLELFLKLSVDKLRIKVYCLYYQNFSFLNYIIGLDRVTSSTYSGSRKYMYMQVPTFYMLNTLYLSKFFGNYKFSLNRAFWLRFTDDYIVMTFNSILSSLFDYYSGVDTPRKLMSIQYSLKNFCAKVLGYKHGLSLAEVYEKYGVNLSCLSSSSDKEGIINENFCLGLRSLKSIRKLWNVGICL